MGHEQEVVVAGEKAGRGGATHPGSWLWTSEPGLLGDGIGGGLAGGVGDGIPRSGCDPHFAALRAHISWDFFLGQGLQCSLSGTGCWKVGSVYCCETSRELVEVAAGVMPMCFVALTA